MLNNFGGSLKKNNNILSVFFCVSLFDMVTIANVEEFVTRRCFGSHLLG